MKKLSPIFLAFLFLANLYAENFAKRYTFDCNSISKLKASLQFENINITNTNTKRAKIIIDVKADDEKFMPEIVQNVSVLTIKNAFSNFTNKSSCDVNILVPEAFAPDSIYLETHYGKITLSIPEEESFIISADSFNSKFINKYTGVVKTYIRDGIEYTHNKGGAVISLKTHTGDITIQTTAEY